MGLIENTNGRLKIIEILANFFRSVIVLYPDDLLQCVYLCLNKVAPAFKGLSKLIKIIEKIIHVKNNIFIYHVIGNACLTDIIFLLRY